jgi:hypothetical protein
MRISIFIIFFSIIALLSTCTNKKIDLEVFEKDCRNFKISNPVYQNIFDPSCGTGVSGQFRVVFNFDGKDKCLKKVVNNPKFYDAKNNEISGVTFQQVYNFGETNITQNGNTITYVFDYSFSNTTDADKLNSIYLAFNTLNEIGNPSNTLELRINAQCSTVDPSTYTTVRTVNVSSSNVSIKFWDNAAEDGDIISVNLNGVWVLENYMITNAGQTFNFPINSGSNKLVVYAVNQGKSGPNTLSISVNSGSEIQMSPELLTGEAVTINF